MRLTERTNVSILPKDHQLNKVIKVKPESIIIIANRKWEHIASKLIQGQSYFQTLIHTNTTLRNSVTI